MPQSVLTMLETYLNREEVEELIVITCLEGLLVASEQGVESEIEASYSEVLYTSVKNTLACDAISERGTGQRNLPDKHAL